MGQLCPHCRSRFDDDTLERCPHDRKRLVADLTGHTIADRYTLRELLGVGGMDSSVWMAWQTSTQRSVAVKVLPPVEGDAADRFARGGRIASNLNHPNITIVHDYGRTEGGGLYLVMEHLEGVTLYRALRKTPFPLERTVHVLDQVLRALGHAHRRGVVHRDIKLSNLFLTPRDDDPDFVKVLDFGIARFIEEPPEGWGGDHANNEITTTRQLCGTPQYMAPEQIGFGRIDARADLYAVGVAAYRMITGRFPFQGTPHDQFRAHLQSNPPPFVQVRPDLAVPPEIEAWVMRALEKDPDQRFASAEEMRTALRLIRKRHDIGAGELEDSSVRSAPHSRSSSVSWVGEAHSRPTEHIVPEAPPRRRTVVWVALVVLLLAIIAALLFTRPDRLSDPHITALQPREPIPTVGAGAAPALDAAVPDAAPPAPDAAPDAAPAARSVQITSNPPGATVTRDGRALGTTPLTIELPPGAHALYLERAGYDAATVRVDVGADGTEAVRAHGVLDRQRAAARPPRPTPEPPRAHGVLDRQRAAARPPRPTPEPPPPAPEPDAAPPPTVEKKAPPPKKGVTLQLLDEDEARTFDLDGKKKPATGPATPSGGGKPSVELLDP